MTNQDTGDCQKRLVQRRVPFVANAQTAVLVQPTDGALNHPAMDTQATSMGRFAFGQHRFDAAPAQCLAVRCGVVGAIALHTLRSFPWPSRFSGDRRYGIDERYELGYVVTMSGGNFRRERNAMGVCDHMVFRAFFAAIRGTGAGVPPPKTARTEPESTTARDQSILSAACKWPNKSRWILVQTPARCHWRRRRQQVMPLPHPNSCGRYSHGVPVTSTYKMPVNALRLLMGLRPGNRKRRRFGLGNTGSRIAHNESSKRGLAIQVPPCTALTLAHFSKLN